MDKGLEIKESTQSLFQKLKKDQCGSSTEGGKATGKGRAWRGRQGPDHAEPGGSPRESGHRESASRC